MTWLEIWLRNRWIQHSLRILFAALITVLLAPFKLDVLEYTTYDWRMRLSPRPDPSGHVVLLPIEHLTLKKLHRDPEALDWAVVLQKLAQMKPAHVVTFINPSQIQGSYDDLALMADIAATLPFKFGENDLPKTGNAALDPLAAPFEHVAVAPAPKTADRTMLAKDGVTRRLILSYESQPTLFARLSQLITGPQPLTSYSGRFDFLDSVQMLIRYRNKGAYPSHTFIDVLEKTLDPEDFRGKIVLIGKDYQEAGDDYVTTPLSKNPLALSKLEMYANAIDTVMLNQAPRFTPEWLKVLLTFLISLITIYIVLMLRPARGLLMLGATLAVFLSASVFLFATLHWVIPVAHPLVAVFICYYFVIPYRLIIENRRSWEYYQKNRLLTQVEELKSNFMRMMSHDLKTPLARIQGMTEVISKDSDNLTETQRLAVDTIAESSEELTEFIGSILSLSRIESKEMKLQLRSRDVNQLIREAIRKTEFLAKRKQQEVVTELEPLFSIKLDEDLLRTVLVNLLENAIKYSPENTRILVTTEELNNEVVIQVADQGRGIPPEDLQRVFDRFYRATNSRVNTPGNGLGLFLARYFVTLHHGHIEVESQLEKGSTFTVRLPMNLDFDRFDRVDQPPQGGLYV